MINRRSSLFLFSLLLFITPLQGAEAEERLNAPHATTPPHSTFQEEYYGQMVADPYRPMEKLDDPRVQAWMKEESHATRSILQKIPGRQALVAKMQEFDRRKPAKVYNLSITDNNRYFYLKETPADETGKLCFRDGFKGPETMLFDARKFFAKSGKEYVISEIAPSDDGRKVAIGVSANGSEENILLIMDVATKKLLPEKNRPLPLCLPIMD